MVSSNSLENGEQLTITEWSLSDPSILQLWQVGLPGDETSCQNQMVKSSLLLHVTTEMIDKENMFFIQVELSIFYAQLLLVDPCNVSDRQTVLL